MKFFSAKEAAKILGIAPHTLRYWTKTFPFVAPAKSAGGRLLYSMRDVVLLQRACFFVLQQGLSPAECRKKILEELTDDANFKKNVEINALKADFIGLLRKN